jgi:hypothetical protein
MSSKSKILASKPVREKGAKEEAESDFLLYHQHHNYCSKLLG